jgi:ribosomal protein S2
MKQIAKSGKKILFVATKKQAKDIVAEKIKCQYAFCDRKMVWWNAYQFSNNKKINP